MVFLCVTSYEPFADYATIGILLMLYIVFRYSFYSSDKKNMLFKLTLLVLSIAVTCNIIYMRLILDYGLKFKYLVYVLRDIVDISEYFKKEKKIKNK